MSAKSQYEYIIILLLYSVCVISSDIRYESKSWPCTDDYLNCEYRVSRGECYGFNGTFDLDYYHLNISFVLDMLSGCRRSCREDYYKNKEILDSEAIRAISKFK